MAFYTGSGSSCQIGKESTFGTGVTPTALVNLTSESIVESVAKGDEGSLLVSKTAASRDLMAINVGGSVSFILRPEFAGLLFHAAMGGSDTVAVNGDKVTHTIKLMDAGGNLPSLTLVMDRKAAVKKYSGCTISSLSLDCAAGDYVKGSFDIVGVKEEAGTKASLSSFSIPSYKCTSATFSFGGSQLDVTNVSFSINNGLETSPRTYASGLYAGRPQPGQRSIPISFELPYSSDVETLKSTYLTTDATANVVLHFETAVAGYSIDITFPNVSIDSMESNVSGPGIISTSASGVALTVGNSEPITVVITDKTNTPYGG